MIPSSGSYYDDLNFLANHLKENQDGILGKWEELHDADEQATKLILLSREKFYDHIPQFLERLNERLRNKEDQKDTAKEYGLQRWEHGIDLREISKEWSYLHKVLMSYVNSAAEILSISSSARNEAQSIIANMIHEGIQGSINEYYHLQDREAKSPMKDLESALLKENKFKDENLQQTSHDLKGILFSLQVGISMLEGLNLSDHAKEILKEMSLAAKSLEQFLNNLLGLFRLEAGEEEINISTFDVEMLITEICDSLRPLAVFYSLDLRCWGEEPFQVQGDRMKIKRITQNLLINALNYTDKGHVDVSWELKRKEDWQLTIRDTGPGLSSAKAGILASKSDNDQETSASSEESHGEGIGLVIVRRLCKLLNGIIDVDTAPGEGTTFRIIFPIEYNADQGA